MRKDDDIDEESRHESHSPQGSIAFRGFERASPLQLLELKLKHNGATSNLGEDDDKKENGEKSEQEEADCLIAKKALADMLDKVINYVLQSYDYENLNSAMFRECMRCAPQELVDRWRRADRNMAVALQDARDTPNADNFLALQRARLEKKIAATEIVMYASARKGNTERYNDAKAANEQFKALALQLAEVEIALAGKSEAEKKAFFEEASPALWTQYKRGELPAAYPGGRAAILQSASTGGIEQPFLQSLKSIFTSAGRFIAGALGISQPAPPETPVAPPQPANT